jgi:hypothetical protein
MTFLTPGSVFVARAVGVGLLDSVDHQGRRGRALADFLFDWRSRDVFRQLVLNFGDPGADADGLRPVQGHDVLVSGGVDDAVEGGENGFAGVAGGHGAVYSGSKAGLRAKEIRVVGMWEGGNVGRAAGG